MHSALSPGEQKSCGHDGDTRGQGVLFFQSIGPENRAAFPADQKLRPTFVI